jgi:DNA-binding Xre family transcriptional regulator
MQGQSATVLYRPVGRRELELIREGGFRAFPPPPPGQSMFKPVLTREYADEVALESAPTLTRLESGSQNTTIKTLEQICRALRCNVGDLFQSQHSITP